MNEKDSILPVAQTRKAQVRGKMWGWGAVLRSLTRCIVSTRAWPPRYPLSVHRNTVGKVRQKCLLGTLTGDRRDSVGTEEILLVLLFVLSSFSFSLT